MPVFNFNLILAFDILPKDINYLEALVINGINYNAYVSDYERSINLLRLFNFQPSKIEIKSRI